MSLDTAIQRLVAEISAVNRPDRLVFFQGDLTSKHRMTLLRMIDHLSHRFQIVISSDLPRAEVLAEFENIWPRGYWPVVGQLFLFGKELLYQNVLTQELEPFCPIGCCLIGFSRPFLDRARDMGLETVILEPAIPLTVYESILNALKTRDELAVSVAA